VKSENNPVNPLAGFSRKFTLLTSPFALQGTPSRNHQFPCRDKKPSLSESKSRLWRDLSGVSGSSQAK
jgi:hypothetical protein